MKCNRPAWGAVSRGLFRQRLGIIFALLVLTATTWLAEAQERGQFAVLDYSVLFKEYYKALDSQKNLGKKQDEFQKEFADRTNVLNQIVESAQKLQEDLQSPVLSDSKKKEIMGQLREKKMDLESRQKIVMDYREQCMGVMQKMQAQESESILADISKATTLVAKNKYTIVFSKSKGSPLPGTVTYNEGIDDITQQVLAILNKDAPAGVSSKKEDKK